MKFISFRTDDLIEVGNESRKEFLGLIGKLSGIFQDVSSSILRLNHDSCIECTKKIFFVKDSLTFPVMREDFSHGYVVLIADYGSME